MTATRSQANAAYYPFSSGKTVVSMGNSVGVLQDVWPGEMLGLLQHGVRVGNWFKQVLTLKRIWWAIRRLLSAAAGAKT